MTKKEIFNGIDDERKIELWSLATAIGYGDYTPSHEYVGFDGNGNLKSYYSIWDVIDYICKDDEYIDFAIKRA